MQTNNLSKDQVKVTATGFLSLLSIVGIMFYGLPFFFDFWVREFGWTRATVSSGNLIGRIVVGPLLGFAAGWFIDRYGPRKLMIIGILMAGIAVMSLGTMTSIWQFYFFYFFIAAGYMCGGPLPNQVLISRWFDTARGKAMGIAYLGIGVGGMLVPQFARWLNVQLDWRGSLEVLGGAMILIALPMALFVKETPESEKIGAIVAKATMPLSTILKSRSFYLLAIGSVCSIAAVSGMIQNLKLFLSLDLKYSQGQAANVISLVLGASILGRLLMGYLADRYPKKYVMVLIYTIISFAIALLYFSGAQGMIYLFAFIFGIGLGGDYMIIPLMAADLFGVKVMGRVMGLILTVDGLAEAIGPVLTGAIRDRTGSYVMGFTMLIVLSIVGTAAILMLPGKKIVE